jgi:diguanylate cyclase (GGDEF)-like protein
LERARSQVRERRYTERLRDNVQISIEMAITDALTGLFNRRYMESHLTSLLEQAGARGKPLTVLVLDIDYSKSINDSHGHDAGDDVLREFALRVKRSIRGIDLACRYGGEESLVVMPETDMAVAAMVAERLRASPPSRSQSTRARAALRSRSRSTSPLCAASKTTPPASSNAPIRRSIAPSVTGETGWSRTLPDPGGSGPSSSGLAAHARPNWHYG